MEKISIVILVIFMPLGNIFALSESEEVIEYLKEQERIKNIGLSTGAIFGVTCATIISTSFWNPAGQLAVATCGTAAIVGCTAGESVTRNEFTPTMCSSFGF